jgi:hypothetical protein
VLYLTWLGDSPDRVLLLKSLIFVPALVLLVVNWWTRKHKNQHE